MIGRKKNTKKCRRRPEPIADRSIPGFKRIAVDDVACDEAGKQANTEREGEKDVREKQTRQGGIAGRCAGVTAERGKILRHGFGREDCKKHGVGVIHIEHQASDQGEDEPLGKRPSGAGLVPVPYKKRDDESGMRVGPSWIEIHIHGKRTGPPDGNGGKQGPAFLQVVAGETESQQQTKESVERGGKSHSVAIGGGEAIGRDPGTKGASEKDARMSHEQKRRPEDGGTNREMVFEVAGGGAKERFGLARLVHPRIAKAGIRMLIVMGEIKTVFDEGSADKSIVTNTVAANPGIEEGEREHKKQEEYELRIAQAG